MIKRSLLLLLALFGSPVLSQAADAQTKQDRVEIVLYHSNDIHGYIGPMPADPKKGTPASGGAASLATLLKSETRPYLYLDSGDWYQGDPKGSLTKGTAVIDALNLLKPAGAVFGNHDFDDGAANAARLAARAAFPILGSNILSEATQKTVDYAKPYILETRGGVKIGIFGLLTMHMDHLAFPENVKGLTFQRETEAAAKAVSELKAQGAQVIVAVNHVGIEEYGGKDFRQSIPEGDIHLAQTVPGIDVILGGHNHVQIAKPVVVAKDGRRTVITQTSGRLQSVYQLALVYDKAAGRLESVEGAPVPLDPERFKPDEDMLKLVERAQAEVDKTLKVPLGSSAVEMPHSREAAYGPTLIGNWISDAVRRRSKADVAVMNTLGIRAGLPAGPLAFGDVYKVMPFDNRIVTVEITGAELRRLVEENLQDGTYWLQYSGLEFVYDRRKAFKSRVLSLSVGGQAVSDEKIYTLASNDFVIQVDRAFQGIKTANFQALAEPDGKPSLLRDWLAAEVKERSPISAAQDGRARQAP